MMRVPLKSVEEMLRLAGENASLLSALAALQRRFELQSRTLDEQFRALAARIADLEMVVDVRRPAGLSRAAGSAEGINSAEGFDALEMDHYNEVHGATRALTEAAADARSVGREVQATVAQLARLLGEGQQTQEDLQFHTLGMRLAPLSSLSARLQRAVRQAASATGRDATLIIEGDAIEVDGEIVNQLADPLLHMLRNAVDHGIEPPEARIAAGKPRQGRVHLSFARAGQQLVVTCRDDGAGLDLERIRTKAEWLGLIAPGTAPGEAELARVILLPGFSTRDAVSEVSGRGIGLDVVRERVERMGGSLDIATTRGMGTTLTIRLQASLAVLLALMIEVDGQLFAVPCHSVSAGLAAGQASVEVDDSGARFVVGEDHIPARAARALLGYEREFDHIDEWSARPALLVGHGDDRIAVAVDRIVEVKELFMRKTGEYLAGVPGFAGASVLGDGAVVPILDFPGLLRAPLPEMPESAMPAPQARFKGRVLAVDDSLSVRDMISDLLRDAGYEVETAIDGMAALRKMETFLPQVLITDLEMPNLNGLELTARLRRDPRTAELPVVMITSRSQDKHRAMAAEAGVTRYLTKPYTDDRLLEAVSELMGGAPAVAETSESLV
jgi:chemosensory pili system protein ChpA (sensor histidine kinase/response regulator)